MPIKHRIQASGENIEIGPGLVFNTGSRENSYVLEDIENGGLATVSVRYNGRLHHVSLSTNKKKVESPRTGGIAKKADADLCKRIGKDVWYVVSEDDSSAGDGLR